VKTLTDRLINELSKHHRLRKNGSTGKWWNPAVEDQASDRAHRYGQERPVTVIRMVTGGTIEEQIQELLASKRELADSILAGTDSTSLNAQHMIELLQVGFKDA